MAMPNKTITIPVSVILLIILQLIFSPLIHAQINRNTITFENQSGNFAIVKLIGPTKRRVDVPNGQNRTVGVSAGEYYILVRYGEIPSPYIYTKGDAFTVKETAEQYSIITITLHKVEDGNYKTRGISHFEFDNIVLDSIEDTITTTKDGSANALVNEEPRKFFDPQAIPEITELPKIVEIGTLREFMCNSNFLECSEQCGDIDSKNLVFLRCYNNCMNVRRSCLEFLE